MLSNGVLRCLSLRWSLVRVGFYGLFPVALFYLWKICLRSAKSYEAQEKSLLFKWSTITMFIIGVVKGWFLWMIVGCYLGRVTNLLALLWLIYGPSLRATVWRTVLHCVTLWCTVVHYCVLCCTVMYCGSLWRTVVHCIHCGAASTLYHHCCLPSACAFTALHRQHSIPFRANAVILTTFIAPVIFLCCMSVHQDIVECKVHCFESLAMGVH